MDYQYGEDFDSHFPQDMELLSAPEEDSHILKDGSLNGTTRQVGTEDVHAVVSFPNNSSISFHEGRKSGIDIANNCNIGNGNSKPKRTRARGEALDILKREFEGNPNPPPQRRRKLSEMTGLPEKNVRIWFQNRRAKLRKDDRAGIRDTGIGGGNDNIGDNSGFFPHANGVIFRLFDKIPLSINNNYYFIDICSVTVGSWNRMKSGALRRSNWSTIKDLSNLSPISINEIMSSATDLMVLVSKKNFEINYFFSAVANNTKILFRIFFPINSVVDCSLSLETNDIMDPRSPNRQDDDNTLNNEPKHFNEGDERFGELRINVLRPPNFAVYFLETSTQAINNQWSICEDFSEGRQVNDAFVGGSNLPHVLKGLQNSLRFMNSLILDYNSTNPIMPQPGPQRLELGSNSLSIQPSSTANSTSFFNEPNDASNHTLDMQKDAKTAINDAGSHDGNNNDLSTNNYNSSLLSLSHDGQGVSDFFKNTTGLTDETRWL